MTAVAEGKKTRRQSSRMRLALLSLVSFVLLVMVGSICLIFLLLNSPSALNGLAALVEPVAGYRVQVDDVSLSKGLEGNIVNLRITQRGDRLPLASFDRVDFKTNPNPTTSAFVEKIILHRPKFRFVLKPDKKETDWSGLYRLPPVKLLQIKGGEIDVTGEAYHVLARDLNITINDFSPREGGRARLASALVLDGPGGADEKVDKLNGEGTISADIQLARLVPTIGGKGTFSIKLKSAVYRGSSFRDVALDIPLSLDSRKLLFDRTALRIGSLEYEADGGRRAIKNAKLNGAGSFDRRSSLLTLRDIKGQLSDTGEFSGSAMATLSDKFPFKASFSARSIDFARLFALMNPFLPEDYRKWGIQGKGDLTAELENRWADEDGFSGVLRLRLRDAGFSSADKTRAGAGLTGEVLLRLGPPRSKQHDVTGRVEMDGGEFLWGSYYRDFKGERLSLSSKGRLSLGAETSLALAGEVDFYQTGDYGFRAAYRQGFLSVDATARNVSNSRLHDLLLKDYFGEESALFGAHVSGVSHIEVSLERWNGAVTAITGRVRTADLSLNLPKAKLVVEKLDLDLPFDLSPNGIDEVSNGDQGKGHIRLKRFQRAGIMFQNVEIPVATARNRFEIPKDIDVELFGGWVRVGALRIANPLSPQPEVSARIRAEHMDMSKITEELMGKTVQGLLDADLGEVSLRQGEWTAPGTIRAKIFGGEAEVRNLSGANLLASSRTLAGDVFFGGIDLEQVTNLMGAGKVTGFIKGSITGLAFAYGEPSSFVLVLESDTAKSVRQMISVDAIENLSIIGTGSSGISAVLNSGINRFFRAYPYSRIGIMCTLKNDTFRLRGTIREGNTEFLVRRGLIRGIDVINQNPDNAISFRDMQERIGRIFKSGKVRTEVS